MATQNKNKNNPKRKKAANPSPENFIVSDNKTQDSKQYIDKPKTFGQGWKAESTGSKLTIVITFGLTVFTMVLAGFTWGLVNDSQRQTETFQQALSTFKMQDSVDAVNFRIEQRALIVVSNITPLFVKNKFNTTDIKIESEIVNIGKTLAKDYRLARCVFVIKNGEDYAHFMNDSLENTPIETLTLEPQIKTHPSPIGAYDIPVSDMNSLMSGKLVLYYYITISYQDIFGERHNTKVLVKTDPRSKGFITTDAKYNVVE